MKWMQLAEHDTDDSAELLCTEVCISSKFL